MNRTISLWNTAKKKPIFTYQLAHGVSEHLSETEEKVVNPRWITSLATLPYSDLFVSGELTIIPLTFIEKIYAKAHGMDTFEYGELIPN